MMATDRHPTVRRTPPEVPPGEGPVRASAPSPRHARTCIGCREEGAREDLVRLVAGADGRVVIDARARAGGRGAWVHATRSCVLAAARRHAAERTLKIDVRKDLDGAALVADLRVALARKALSLLVVAARTRRAAVGADAVADALETRRVPLVLVATDAGENARALAGDDGVRTMVGWTKSELGRVFRRAEVALVALLDVRVAAELVSTMDRLAGLEDR